MKNIVDNYSTRGYIYIVENVSTNIEGRIWQLINSELLKSEIDDLGIRQNVLAEKCGVSRQTMVAWLENPKLISAYHARVLADALRITDEQKLLAIFFAPNVEDISTKPGIDD